jgi:hypothetical protein
MVFPPLYGDRHMAQDQKSTDNTSINLGHDGVHLCFNQSGNRLSDARSLRQFPDVHNASWVMTVVLLDNGPAFLVVESPAMFIEDGGRHENLGADVPCVDLSNGRERRGSAN